MSKSVSLFSDEGMNALYQAIRDCATDSTSPIAPDFGDYHMYTYLENTPRCSMVAEVVDKLRVNGWDITKRK